jgi:hypothetical protein
VLEQRRQEVSTLEEKQRARQLAEAQHQAVINDAVSLAGGQPVGREDPEVTDEHGKEKTIGCGQGSARKLVGPAICARHETPARRSTSRSIGSARAKRTRVVRLLKRGYVQATRRHSRAPSCRRVSTASDRSVQPALREEPLVALEARRRRLHELLRGCALRQQVAGFDKRTAVVNALEVNKDPTKYESPYWKQKFDDISAP